MTAPDWVGVVKDLVAPASVAVTYLLTRAGKTAVNQTKLEDVCIRVERAERRLDGHDKTLVEHQTLHKGYVFMQGTVQTIDRKLNAVCGKLGIDGT